MCLESLRSEFQEVSNPKVKTKGVSPRYRDGLGIWSEIFYAYKLIHRDLRSMYNQHFWSPDNHFTEHKAKNHPPSKKVFKVYHSFHAYRYLEEAKEEYRFQNNQAHGKAEVVIIRIQIERFNVTGANLSQVAARRVYWDGSYLCKNRWKKLKINW